MRYFIRPRCDRHATPMNGWANFERCHWKAKHSQSTKNPQGNRTLYWAADNVQQLFHGPYIGSESEDGHFSSRYSSRKRVLEEFGVADEYRFMDLELHICSRRVHDLCGDDAIPSENQTYGVVRQREERRVRPSRPLPICFLPVFAASFWDRSMCRGCCSDGFIRSF